ncbi:DNA polymerase III subunit delta' [bacterium]|nr:DNA polymerase III subunit delta' [bacterium]
MNEDKKHIINDKAGLFPSVIGQQAIKQNLKRILLGERMAHAYLFIGQEGTGRLAMALEIARVLNCSDQVRADSFKGCTCNSCRSVLAWQHPNIYPIFPLPRLDKNKGEDAQKAFEEIISIKSAEIYAPLTFTDTGRILLDQIRELRNKLSLLMDRSGKRVVIVHSAERIRDEAANAFLKLLEEPPHDCCLILCSSSVRDLLPTIVSRCQIVNFPPLKQKDITDGLIKVLGINREKAETAARLSQGSFTRALQHADDEAIIMLEEGLDFLRSSVTGNVPKINEYVNNLSKAQRSDVIKRLTGVSFWIRDALTFRAFNDNADLHRLTSSEEKTVSKIASRYNDEQLQKIWREIERACIAIDDNGNVPLVLIALGVNIYRIAK